MTLAGLTLTALPVSAQPSISYLYRLSDFSGPVASLWARIAVDQEQGEIYTLNQSDSVIQIYNDAAMQVYDCGEDLALASSVDIAAAENGDLFVLYRTPARTVRHLNFRGELIEEIQIDVTELRLRDFNPVYLDYKKGDLYLADSEKMRVVVTSATGEVKGSYNFRKQLESQIRAGLNDPELRESQRKRLQDKLAALRGADFSVDAEGNIFFTIAPLFAAFRATPDGALAEFGTPGGAPGKFGVVASISADSDGNIFVSDRLRCVVLMFDKDFNFLTEFGYRGEQPANLVVPDDIAIDERNGRIYVAQAANLGVSVFGIKHD
jgi:DNA-binding beta-propeller fold protein YncE